MKKKLFVLLILATLTVILFGLISTSFLDERPRVVIVLKDLNTDYWNIIKKGAEKGFVDFDINGEVIAPFEGSAEEQNELLKFVLKEKPDVLVVAPSSPELTIPILERFVEESIPVLLLDTDNPWDGKTTYIGTDNFDLGRKAGALLATELQPGNKVALIGGDVESPVGGGRLRGAKIMLEAAGIDIGAEKINLADELTEITEAVEAILTEHTDIKGIIASNDSMALYALQVIEEEGFSIPVIGADGMNEFIELIEDGILPGTVAQNPYDMGYISVETARKVIEGIEVEEEIDSGVDIIIKGNAKRRLEFQKRLLQ